MPKVNIVIPCYNHYDLTNLLLWQLYQKEYENIDQILVVDDASTDEDVEDGLKWWQSNGMLPLLRTRNQVNQGFLKTANLGLKIIVEFETTQPDDIIILISNDVQIHGKFIDEIKAELSNPWSNLVGGKLLDWDTGWNQFNGKIYPYLEGWLLATTVKNWKELGYFDERYSPCDMEDIDLSTKANELGYSLYTLDSPNIFHAGAGTLGYTEKRMEQTLKNKKLFEEKWIK